MSSTIYNFTITTTATATTTAAVTTAAAATATVSIRNQLNNFNILKNTQSQFIS